MNDSDYLGRIADATEVYHTVVRAALDAARDTLFGNPRLTVAASVARWDRGYASVFDLPHVVTARERFDAALAMLRPEWPDHPYWGSSLD